jgi:hypothetical protein
MGKQRQVVGTASAAGIDYELFLEEGVFRWYREDGTRTEIEGYTITQARRKLTFTPGPRLAKGAASGAGGR